MAENKTKPTKVRVSSFLATVSVQRQNEAYTLIELMKSITGEPPVLWGPSIIGFGTQRYRHHTGREGDMPRLAFSPRKAAITIYFEGFENYREQLTRLGKHKTTVACLYLNKLTDVDVQVLREMLALSYQRSLTTDQSARC